MSGRERRLAAIVAIDVAGYSRMMHADEAGTLDRLKQARAVSDPIGRQHGGRIVGTAGDGLLVEFPSVVEAVSFALRTQAALADFNAAMPDAEKLLYRIGINVGDVLVDDGDIYGDGVNVAARLEALAEPGGICISRAARDQVRDKLDVVFEDMGEVAVKHIARPVRTFRLSAAPATIAALAPAEPVGRRPDITPADPARFTHALPEKPSIAVLPLDNLTGDIGQDYIGDGLTENIIAVLSSSPDMFVIARNSTFTYKGRPTKVQEIAEQLGVRYVMEGSVQRAGNRLRVTAQLVDAVDGRHLWAERFDRSIEDLFELQDDITQRILEAMHVRLTHGAQAGFWREIAADPEVYRLFMQGLPHCESLSVEGHREARRLWSKAYERQPDGMATNVLMGWLSLLEANLGLAQDNAVALATARRFAATALSQLEASYTHTLLAAIDLYERKYDAALAHADRAVEIAPSHAHVLNEAGYIKVDAGSPAEGIELLKRSMRLHPSYPPVWAYNLCWAHLQLGEFAEARALADKLAAVSPGESVVPFWALHNMAAAAVFQGDLAAAEEAATRILALQPKSSIAMVTSRLGYIRDRRFLARYLDALRRAGLAETG